MGNKSKGKILAVCTSSTRGIAKSPVEEIEIVVGYGIRGDAHAGHPTRQVSLLADESAEVMRGRGLEIGPGALGENVVTQGIVLKDLAPECVLRIGKEVTLEVAEIGKQQQEPNAIQAAVGDSIMLTEGVFCRVLEGGRVRPGDRIEVQAAENAR
jgi:MOSC domain-containing protein YiiM